MVTIATVKPHATGAKIDSNSVVEHAAYGQCSGDEYLLLICHCLWLVARQLFSVDSTGALDCLCSQAQPGTDLETAHLAAQERLRC